MEAHLPVSAPEAADICRRALLERGCQIEILTEERIKARAPGSLIRKYVAYELELAEGRDDGTVVRIATWTSNLFSTPNDLVGRAARELQQTLLYESSRRA